MDSGVDDLYDDYPVGWVLTYRRGRAPGSPTGGCEAGVVVGPPARDPRTGLEKIPLSPLDGGRTVWVPDREVIGIEPRRLPPS
ncbi:hypothetical protein [Amycolatopsis sp. cg9]|uniref:hypothetical protein n=1 Tax=Amycolatopsis sp. cg9 TaxID=3238801 RepID=UPI003523D4E9